MFSDQFIDGVSVESGHKHSGESGALPPVVELGISSEESGRQGEGEGLSGSGPLEPKGFPDDDSQCEEGHDVEEWGRAVEVVVALQLVVGEASDHADGVERESRNDNALYSKL